MQVFDRHADARLRRFGLRGFRSCLILFLLRGLRRNDLVRRPAVVFAPRRFGEVAQVVDADLANRRFVGVDPVQRNAHPVQPQFERIHHLAAYGLMVQIAHRLGEHFLFVVRFRGRGRYLVQRRSHLGVHLAALDNRVGQVVAVTFRQNAV